MRHIDIGRLEEEEGWPPGKLEKRNPEEKRRTPEEWRRRLAAAEAEMCSAPSGSARGRVIAKYSDLWSEVKDKYRLLLDGKCWYCETKTASGEMDHYRPKGGVTENKNHPGYWWLAFDWRNWRYCCKRCNSEGKDPETGLVGGKGNKFPLMDGEVYRVMDKGDYEDYEDLLNEDPLLLDPTVRRDTFLLTFTSDGQPGPATNDERTTRRVAMSIRAYHLDHSTLKRERRKICMKVRELANDAQRYWKKWILQRDRSALALHNRAIENLGRMIARDAEYSATARAYLREYRSNDSDWMWVDQLLTG